jgi:hypothetical protein
MREMTPEQRQAVVATWPEWMRREWAARVELLHSCGWLHRAQAEALAFHGVLAQAQEALQDADVPRAA